ncbi:MAG: hypothetical protein ACTSUE_01630 [Promethearchaeota archaeon]
MAKNEERETVQESGDFEGDVTTEEEIDAEDRMPRLFPLRLGFFTLLFLIFFAISVALLNLVAAFFESGSGDLFQDLIEFIRTIITIPGIAQFYDFIVPESEDEALFISACMMWTFLIIAFISMKNSGRRALFEKGAFKRGFLQIALFFVFFILIMQLLKFFDNFIPEIDGNMIPLLSLVIGASFWIFFQSLALFTAARRTGTNVEQKLLDRGGRGSSTLVSLAPFFTLLYVIGLTVGFMIFPDVLEHYTGITDFQMDEWAQKMLQIIGFIVGALCILPSIIAAGAKNPKQKRYDSMVVLMSIIAMYPYLLFNFALYFWLPSGSSSGSNSQILLWVELLFTLVMLVSSIRSVGQRTNYKFGKLQKHAFILFIYSALTGQFGIRYLQTKGNLPGGIADFLIDGQYIIINAFVLLALIFSVLLFSSEKFGVYFRVHEQVSKADKKRMEFVYQQMKHEYNKQEGPYLVTEIYENLAMIMKAGKLEVMDLVEKTYRKYSDLNIDGLKKRYVCFDAAKQNEMNLLKERT